MTTKKTVTKSTAKAAGKSKTVALKKVKKPIPAKPSAKASPKATKLSKSLKPTKAVKPKAPLKPAKPVPNAPAKPAPKPAAPTPVKATSKALPPVTAKKIPASASTKVDPTEIIEASAPSVAKPATPAKSKTTRTTLDDLALDIDEKDELLEEEKRDLIKALRDDEDEPLETAFVPTDTSERYILVVDEEGQRRNETVTIVQQILPNAVVEVADDPEEAHEIMQEADFDTFVVNFLMPGYSASPFVKAVANHPDHPLLIGFAADKISDALDQRKGLKIIPLKRLFDLDVPADAAGKEKAGAED